MISKSERDELRRLVRQQMKTLAAEVHQRQRELLADVEAQIEETFAAEDRRYDQIQGLIDEAVTAANRAVNDILREHLEDWPTHHDKVLVVFDQRGLSREDIHRRKHELRLVPAVRLAELEADLRGGA